MVTAEILAARKTALSRSGDLRALLATLARRADRLLGAAPVIPPLKALLSQDGGVCPVDGAALAFDPWSPDAHRCPRCDQVQRGPRHDRAWARYQHLWLAERAVELATLAALGEEATAAAERAQQLLAGYGERYFSYPNRDNVLGPARLFFSTYLESLWITHYVSAAAILRAADRLDAATARAVNAVADEAANLIGEYDERWSNRQTWNNTALVAIATWFGDGDLLRHAVAGETGLAAHLLEGFRPDGMWYEGENYHLFALRGLLLGLSWLPDRAADLLEDPRVAARLTAALLAPARTALPDGTFPARKDSRFGVSLAQPMYLETWEVGLALVGSGTEDPDTADLVAWLHHLYRTPSPPAQLIDAYLHEATLSPLPAPRTRRDLSAWSLLTMLPELPSAAEPWHPGSVLLSSQGLAVLRTGERYVSLECGPYAGGHGHADRLHLTLHDGRVHWLPDFGTGSYLTRDLFWYRGTLAHNAPRLDGVDQSPGSAECLAFDTREGWGWVRGRFGDVTRTIVTGPDYVIDLVVFAGRDDHTLEVPWHCAGRLTVDTPGTWRPDALVADGVTDVERFEPRGEAPVLRAAATTPAGNLLFWLLGERTLLAATGPGRPGAQTPERFWVVRGAGRTVRLLTVVTPGGSDVVDVRWNGDQVDVVTRRGVDRHRDEGTAWHVALATGGVTLAGVRERAPAFTPFLVLEPVEPARGLALAVADAPACDGTLAGFDLAEPLTLELEDQYRRSEEPWPGSEELRAACWVNWTADALCLALDVVKPDPWFRPKDAPPQRLDNEPDDIHSDGVQVYLRAREGGGFAGYLVVPEPGGAVRVRGVAGTDAVAASVRGRWAATAEGYRVTLAVAWPEWMLPHPGAAIGFDVVVNEMYAGRERRAGQLVWSGGNGWVWLRGDRADPERLGLLELIG